MEEKLCLTTLYLNHNCKNTWEIIYVLYQNILRATTTGRRQYICLYVYIYKCCVCVCVCFIHERFDREMKMKQMQCIHHKRGLSLSRLTNGVGDSVVQIVECICIVLYLMYNTQGMDNT